MRGHFAGHWLSEKTARILPKRISYELARWIAEAYGLLVRPDVEAVTANLRAALQGDFRKPELERLARTLIVHYSRYLVDLFYSRRIDEVFIREHVTIENRSSLDEALARGKGAIAASAHLGNWEIGGMVMARLGYPVHGIALRHRDVRVDRMFVRRRLENRLETIPAESFMRDCYRVLEKNQLLALNGDRLYGGGGIPVSFLGRTVFFPRGPAHLSLETGAPVLPVFFIAETDARYRLQVGPPLSSHDEISMTQEFASIVEENVRRTPLQWFVFQPFWEKAEWPA